MVSHTSFPSHPSTGSVSLQSEYVLNTDTIYTPTSSTVSHTIGAHKKQIHLKSHTLLQCKLQPNTHSCAAIAVLNSSYANLKTSGLFSTVIIAFCVVYVCMCVGVCGLLISVMPLSPPSHATAELCMPSDGLMIKKGKERTKKAETSLVLIFHGATSFFGMCGWSHSVYECMCVRWVSVQGWVALWVQACGLSLSEERVLSWL